MSFIDIGGPGGPDMTDLVNRAYTVFSAGKLRPKGATGKVDRIPVGYLTALSAATAQCAQ